MVEVVLAKRVVSLLKRQVLMVDLVVEEVVLLAQVQFQLELAEQVIHLLLVQLKVQMVEQVLVIKQLLEMVAAVVELRLRVQVMPDQENNQIQVAREPLQALMAHQRRELVAVAQEEQLHQGELEDLAVVVMEVIIVVQMAVQEQLTLVVAVVELEVI